MGTQDRDYNRGGGAGDYGEGGGFRRAFRRMFVEGDNFFGWSIPIYRLAGITVKIHILYLAYVAAKLIWPLAPGAVGFWFTAFFFLSGFVFVLLHEYGHCFACRAVGGDADQIIMWPLGGLAFCRPPHNWKAALITTVCGPAVNLALAAIFAAALLAAGAGWSAIFFNLFDMWSGTRDPWFDQPAAYWKILLYCAYAWNVYNFLFNFFLPMFPMDGGRILQELLWWKLGYKKATLIAVNVGLFVAVILGAVGLSTNHSLLVTIALFGGITCFTQRRALAMMADEPAWAYDTDKGNKGFGPPNTDPATATQEKAYKAALKRQQKEQEGQHEVDRILDKIRDQGMQSLSGREKSILKDATERGKGRG